MLLCKGITDPDSSDHLAVLQIFCCVSAHGVRRESTFDGPQFPVIELSEEPRVPAFWQRSIDGLRRLVWTVLHS